MSIVAEPGPEVSFLVILEVPLDYSVPTVFEGRVTHCEVNSGELDVAVAPLTLATRVRLDREDLRTLV